MRKNHSKIVCIKLVHLPYFNGFVCFTSISWHFMASIPKIFNSKQHCSHFHEPMEHVNV